MSCFVDCLSQGLDPLVHNLSDSLSNEAMLFCRDKECTGKEIATWQHSAFDKFEPVIAQSPHPLDSDPDLFLRRIQNVSKENVGGTLNYSPFQFFLGAKVH